MHLSAAGTYSYTVYTNQGLDDNSVTTPEALTGSKVFTITVAPVVATTTTTSPPPTTTTTPPPVTTRARIDNLSPDEGYIGTQVTITGTGFGTAGVVKFGTVAAKASFYSATKIVVVVPSGVSRDEIDVTVTPRVALRPGAPSSRSMVITTATTLPAETSLAREAKIDQPVN